ncbi:hypothetical protein Q9233_000587 [Columba guinea]|nr:hypothetical protein Q9233_000587 [Columba guinea]
MQKQERWQMLTFVWNSMSPSSNHQDIHHGYTDETCLGCRTRELLSQPRPEGLTEIICPKNGSERVNVALVYPPTPTVTSPCSK